MTSPRELAERYRRQDLDQEYRLRRKNVRGQLESVQDFQKKHMDPRRYAHGRRYDLAEHEDELIDPDKAPKPKDFYGYDGTVVRIVPNVNHLIEVVVSLPTHVWEEVLRYLEDNGYFDDNQVDEKGNPGVEFDEKKFRIIRRGKVHSAVNVFIDRE